MAMADFFAAIALVALALYGHQRQENLRVSHGIRDLARAIHLDLTRNGIDNRYDEASASIVLQEDAVLFESGAFEITNPTYLQRVRVIGNVIKSAAGRWHDRFIIVIRGHTDAWEPRRRSQEGAQPRYKDNRELSWLRALEVEKRFVELGIKPPEFQVAAQGVGQEEPAVDNCKGTSKIKRARCDGDDQIRDRDDLSRNRRIELKFGHFSGNVDEGGN
jgi:outer membrane protein OmpA-like peptidoglycan-associated protein